MMDWVALETACYKCTQCTLCQGRRNVVFGVWFIGQKEGCTWLPKRWLCVEMSGGN